MPAAFQDDDVVVKITARATTDAGNSGRDSRKRDVRFLSYRRRATSKQPQKWSRDNNPAVYNVTIYVSA